jgi:hypothetical protein
MLIDNDPNRTQTLPYGDAMVDAQGRFIPGPPRPRTSSGVEYQQSRRPRTDIIRHTRPPYTLVPPIATNFDNRFSHAAHSPISRHSSRENTPRGTPTSTKNPQIRNSILDEVEGSLTATLRDFQGLQSFLHHDSPPITPDQLYGPPPLYQPTEYPGLGPRRTSSNSLHPGESFVSQPPQPNWDPSQMAAAVAQQQAQFPNGNGILSMPLTPLRNGPPGNGALTGEYADYDPKFLAIQHAYEEQKKVIHSLQLENGNIRQRVDFLRERLAESENDKTTVQKIQRDAEEKMKISLSKVSQARGAEMAAKNTISKLQTTVDEANKKIEALNIDLSGERNSCLTVQAKLDEANTHKIDLQQAEFDNRRENITTRKKLKKAVDELNTFKRKERIAAAEQASAADAQKKLLAETQAKLEEARKQNSSLENELKKHIQIQKPQADLSSRMSDMNFRIEGLEAELASRDAQIASLVSSNARSSSDRDRDALNVVDASSLPSVNTTTIAHDQSSNVSASTSTAPAVQAPTSPRPVNEVDDIRRMMEVMDRHRRDAAAERDRLAALLFADLRRVAIEEHERRHPSQPFLYQKPDFESAVASIRDRAHAYVKEQHAVNGTSVNGIMASNGQTEDAVVLKEKIGDLEKEIDYYLNDIVLYKLDVRGYKKDLRKAEKRIREMNADGTVSDSKSSITLISSMSTVNGINGVDRGSPDRGRKAPTG